MSEPNTPDVPPVPPAPDAQPAPRFGEFAPVEETPAAAAPEPAPSIAAAPAAPPEAYPQAAGPVYGQPGYGTTAPPRRRRTWDLVLTIILLVLGLGGVAIGLFYAAVLGNQELFAQSLESQGYTWNGTIGAAPAIIAISHVGLYLVALGVSIPLLITRRIVVFWIPLVAGVIAAIVFWVALYSVILSDPDFIASLTATS